MTTNPTTQTPTLEHGDLTLTPGQTIYYWYAAEADYDGQNHRIPLIYRAERPAHPAESFTLPTYDPEAEDAEDWAFGAQMAISDDAQIGGPIPRACAHCGTVTRDYSWWNGADGAHEAHYCHGCGVAVDVPEGDDWEDAYEYRDALRVAGVHAETDTTGAVVAFPGEGEDEAALKRRIGAAGLCAHASTRALYERTQTGVGAERKQGWARAASRCDDCGALLTA